MLGNCWLVKKFPNYELSLTNSWSSLIGFHQIVAIYFTQLLGIYLPTVVKSGWELVTQ